MPYPHLKSKVFAQKKSGAAADNLTRGSADASATLPKGANNAEAPEVVRIDALKTATLEASCRATSLTVSKFRN